MSLEDTLMKLLTEALEDGPKRDDGLTRKSALEQLRDPATDTQTLYRLFKRFDCDEVAEAVARHPNVGSNVLGTLHVFMPEITVTNPAFERISQERSWQRNQDYYARRAKKTSRASSGSFAVSTRSPQLYRVRYFLEHGIAADFRHLAAIEAIPDEVLRPHLTAKSSHLRKALAERPSFEAADYEVLAKDKAKSVRLALAGNPALPEAVVQMLAGDRDADVRSAAAAHPNCPRETVHTVRMSEAAQPTVQSKPVESLSPEEIAEALRDPATSGERLEEIAAGAQPHVRYGCGLHPNAGRALLEALAADGEGWLREAVAFNPATPADILEALAAEPSQAMQRALASNPATPKAIQLWIAEHSPGSVRLLLANASDDADVLARLCKPAGDEALQDWQEHLALALDPEAKPFKLRQLQRSRAGRHAFTARLVARHANCPPSLHAQYGYYCFSDLARNPHFALQVLEDPSAIPREPVKAWVVSEWVADGNIPGHIADHYLVPGDPVEVRRGATSRRASLRALQPLVFHPDPRVRNEVASRRDLTRFMFEALARDRNDKTRELAATNARCPRSLLTGLAQDRVGAVRAAAMANKRYLAPAQGAAAARTGAQPPTQALRNRGPKKARIKMAEEARLPEVLSDLAGDRMVDVRRAVARNDNTPPQVLCALLGDAEPVVRRCAVREELPRETLDALVEDPDDIVRRQAYSVLDYVLEATDQADGDARDELLARAARDAVPAIRSLAALGVRDAEVQVALASDEDPSVVESLAENPSLAGELAAALLESENEKMRERIAYRTPDLDLVERALGDRSESVRINAALNDAIASAPMRFVHHANPMVRYNLARSAEAIPEEVFDILLGDADPQVQEGLASCGELPRARLDKILRGSPDLVRQFARRERLSEEELASLADHEDEGIRALAARDGALCGEAFERLLGDGEAVLEGLRYNRLLSKAQRARAREASRG